MRRREKNEVERGMLRKGKDIRNVLFNFALHSFARLLHRMQTIILNINSNPPDINRQQVHQ